jgi:putative glutamine amidotransferase
VTDRPRIAVTPWRRELPTYLGERTLLDALDPAYTERVADAGALPIVLPRPPAGQEAEIAATWLDAVDGLLLTGGGDVVPDTYGSADEGGNSDMDPGADRWELNLIRSAADRRLPVLAVCRGAQLMAVAFGGRLDQHIPDGAGHRARENLTPEEILAERHPVELAPGSRLAALFGPEVSVNTIHHHSIADAGTLAVTARAAGGLIEGIEPGDAVPGWPMVGVQWHPEKMSEPEQRRLFEAFVDDARRSSP